MPCTHLPPLDVGQQQWMAPRPAWKTSSSTSSSISGQDYAASGLMHSLATAFPQLLEPFLPFPQTTRTISRSNNHDLPLACFSGPSGHRVPAVGPARRLSGEFARFPRFLRTLFSPLCSALERAVQTLSFPPGGTCPGGLGPSNLPNCSSNSTGHESPSVCSQSVLRE
jgi:hypothetical protein